MKLSLLSALLTLPVSVFAAELLIPEAITYCGGTNCKVNQHYDEYGVINNINYRFSHYDASGGLDGVEGGLALGHSFARWTTRCDKDAMTDVVSCFAMKDDLFVIYSPKVGYVISVGTEHFPRSTSFIRVDENKPVESGKSGVFDAKLTQVILEQFKTGKVVKTRYTRWPHDRYINTETSLYGVEQATLFIKWAAHGGSPP